MPETLRPLCTARADLRSKLGAYLDSELDRRAQAEIQAHLAVCPACRDELADLRQLSHLLRAAPRPDFAPAPDFRAQIMLQLPRRTEALPARSNGRQLAWLAPIVVLAGWIFVQVTLGLSGLVAFANQAGLFGSAAAWAGAEPQQMQWFAVVQSMLGNWLSVEGQSGLKFLNDVNVFTQNLTLSLLWQVLVAVFYWGALALVWYKNLGLRLAWSAWKLQ